MRVVAFTKYGKSAASTRYRILQYVPLLRTKGIEVEVHPLLDDDYVASLSTGVGFKKGTVAKSYMHRLIKIQTLNQADIIWVYAELFPYLPAGFERLLFKSGKPVVYDIDDAFFHVYDYSSNPLVRFFLKGKLDALLQDASFCSCGNEYLRQYASRYCDHSAIFPTVVNTEVYAPRAAAAQPKELIVGWIGSPSSWCNVRPLLPVLQQVAREQGVRVRVIGAGRAAEADRFAQLEMVPWVEAEEVPEVQGMDIGIMPLVDEPFQRGKSGFKLIQYMACGLPVIASPVGVNTEIVENGKSGFLATSREEWYRALIRLIGDQDLRTQMGAVGRERATANYSLKVHAPRLANVFQGLVDRSTAESAG